MKNKKPICLLYIQIANNIIHPKQIMGSRSLKDVFFKYLLTSFPIVTIYIRKCNNLLNRAVTALIVFIENRCLFRLITFVGYLLSQLVLLDVSYDKFAYLSSERVHARKRGDAKLLWCKKICRVSDCRDFLKPLQPLVHSFVDRKVFSMEGL